MSTFLELCQETRRECRIAGTGPAAVTAQVGLLADIVAWVKDAYTEIQNRPVNWRWLRHGFTFNTVADDDTYAYGDVTDTTDSAVITRFSRWRVNDPDDRPKIYLTSSGVGTQAWLIYVPWEQFKQVYRMGTQTSGSPAWITIDPQDNLVIGPKPDGIYTITGDYHRSAQILAANDDTPEMPSQYHKLIVYRAMEKYGYAEVAQETIHRGKKDGDTLMFQLESNQIEIPKQGGPLA